MDIKEAIKERHSVRQFQDIPVRDAERENLKELIDTCNAESGLHIQLILDEPGCFDTFLAHYGKFKNASNFIALVGKKSNKDLDERCGYYGQRIVLEAQRMGLNTCWVAGTYGKGRCRASIDADERIVCVIAVGYGMNNGVKHKSKPVAKLCSISEDDMPVWFKNGVEAAMMAPTALNQQKFIIDLKDDEAVITAKAGPMTGIDLGIVKYNFEAASGHKCI